VAVRDSAAPAELAVQVKQLVEMERVHLLTEANFDDTAAMLTNKPDVLVNKIVSHFQRYETGFVAQSYISPTRDSGQVTVGDGAHSGKPTRNWCALSPIAEVVSVDLLHYPLTLWGSVYVFHLSSWQTRHEARFRR
jgi:hypothetical protein